MYSIRIHSYFCLAFNGKISFLQPGDCSYQIHQQGYLVNQTKLDHLVITSAILLFCNHLLSLQPNSDPLTWALKMIDRQCVSK